MAKTQSKGKSAAVAEVLPAESPDLALVQTDGQQIGSFLANMVPFFRTATELERAAGNTLAAAKQLKATPPTTGQEDAAVVVFVQRATADRKRVEEHWGICQVFSGLHRRLTAARGRTVQQIEEAGTIAQGLHNTYKDAELRAARIEDDRRRRLAEEQARVEREAEALRLEQEAVAAEANSPDLSEREADFVDLYAHGQNTAEAAARSAGFKDPFKTAARLLSLPKIQAAIQAKQAAALARQQATATRALPVEVVFEKATPDLVKAGSDRAYWSAEVYDVEAFMAALLDPRQRLQHGIPSDVATFSQPKLNELAKSLHELLDKIPGVRAKKTTKTV